MRLKYILDCRICSLESYSVHVLDVYIDSPCQKALKHSGLTILVYKSLAGKGNKTPNLHYNASMKP